MPRVRARFQPADRIRKSAEFDRGYKSGKRFTSRCFVLLHVQKENGPTRLGVVVSKKTGNAVVRNRWKRVIRDLFRREKGRLPHGGDEVIIVKKSVQGKPEEGARAELLSLFRRVAVR
jgi:ribonuclease P protein component